MNLAGLLGFLTLVVGVPLLLYVTMRLRKLRKGSTNPVLRERTLGSQFVLLNIVVYGLIFANNDQAVPPLDLATTKLITRAATLALIVPALYWLYLYPPDFGWFRRLMRWLRLYRSR